MRRLFTGLALVLLATLSASSVSAGPLLVGDNVTFTNGPGTTGGGEFNATATGLNGVEEFITFCLQRTEYIDYSTTFTIGGINTFAQTDPAANGGDVNGRDPLSAQTAFLYSQFRAGTLANYNYANTGNGRAASADMLQNAIWGFEDELALDSTNVFVIAANNAVSSGAWSGLGNVRAINLFRLDGSEAQDQLSLTAVPEPATMTLLGTGLGIAALRRRFARRRTE